MNKQKVPTTTINHLNFGVYPASELLCMFNTRTCEKCIIFDVICIIIIINICVVSYFRSVTKCSPISHYSRICKIKYAIWHKYSSGYATLNNSVAQISIRVGKFKNTRIFLIKYYLNCVRCNVLLRCGMFLHTCEVELTYTLSCKCSLKCMRLNILIFLA